MATSDVSAQDAREAADRAANSRTFGRAERSKRFLRFVVDQAASGQAERLKEYAIAVEVFDRVTYDPKVDSVVRVEASKLRGLLKAYYEGEGQDEAVQIEMPKGSYVPRFVLARADAFPSLSTSDPAVVPEPVALEPPAGRLPEASPEAGRAPERAVGGARRVRPAWWAATLAAFVAVIAGLTWGGTREGAPPHGPGHRTTSRPSLAILPFGDASPDRAQAALAVQFTDEVRAAVARLETVQIPSNAAVDRFGDGPTDVRVVGRDLGVAAVLEGRVRAEDETLLAEVALVDTRDGLRLWGSEYRGTTSHGSGGVREVAGTIARAVNLLNSTQRALTRPHSPSSEAYKHYVRAAYLEHAGELGAAIDAYRAATVADRDYALAWASLSSVLSLQAHWGFSRGREVTAEAEAAARRALALDPTLPEANQALGRIHALLRADVRTAARSFERAIELDPASIDVREDYAVFVLSREGRLHEARQHLERCLAVDRWDRSARISLAQVLSRLGELDGAEQLLRQLLEEGRAPGVLLRLGNLAALRGRFDEANEHYAGAAGLVRSSWVLGHLGWGLAKAGRADEARAILRELQNGAFAEPMMAEAAVQLGLGDSEAALDTLDRALLAEAHDLPGLALDLRFRDLRASARFRSLVSRVDGPEALRGF